MLDIGWMELMVVGVVALLVVGPKELPTLLRTIGRYVGMAKRQADQFRAHFDEAIRETEFEDLKKEMDDLRRGRFMDTDNTVESKSKDTDGKDLIDVDFEEDGPIEPSPEFQDQEETRSFTMSDGTVVAKQDTKGVAEEPSATLGAKDVRAGHVNGSAPASGDKESEKPADPANRPGTDGMRDAETVR